MMTTLVFKELRTAPWFQQKHLEYEKLLAQKPLHYQLDYATLPTVFDGV